MTSRAGLSWRDKWNEEQNADTERLHHTKTAKGTARRRAGRIEGGQKLSLEDKLQTAPNGAGRLDYQQSMSIATRHRKISLRKQVI